MNREIAQLMDQLARKKAELPQLNQTSRFTGGFRESRHLCRSASGREFAIGR